MHHKNSISLIGYASGVAAGDPGCKDGPDVLSKSDLIQQLQQTSWQADWEAMLYPSSIEPKLAVVADLCTQLALKIKRLVEQKHFFAVLGGDHACAIGTWSGVASALKPQGPIGLIWFDAHMDSHTFETTPSGNIHGMPVASLLGYGAAELINILTATPKLLPEHVCLIGVRSFEAKEAELLKRLRVKVYDMNEIEQRGLAVVVQEAIAIVTRATAAFGVSLDLDCIDPKDAPATGTLAPGGIAATALIEALPLISTQAKFIGAEIAEYNPQHDKNDLTKKLIPQLLKALLPGSL